MLGMRGLGLCFCEFCAVTRGGGWHRGGGEGIVGITVPSYGNALRGKALRNQAGKVGGERGGWGFYGCGRWPSKGPSVTITDQSTVSNMSASFMGSECVSAWGGEGWGGGGR